MKRKDFPAKYKEAEWEARRFLARLAELRDRFDKDEEFARFMGITGSPETSAVRRASMDLTRALARMRVHG